MNQQEMSKTCKKVVNMLNDSHKKLSAANVHERTIDEQRATVASMQDILILLIPYLSPSDAQIVFSLCLKPVMLGNKDNGIQKRTYKLMGKILVAGKLENVDAESLFETLDKNSDNVLAAAKKDRFMLLKALFAHLPSTSLHVIPSFIPEAVLGTKEPSEKARVAAFDLILAMGYKMKEGGTVKRAKLSGMDEDNAAEGLLLIALGELRLRYLINSACESSRVSNHACRRLGWCHPYDDQRDSHRHLTVDL